MTINNSNPIFVAACEEFDIPYLIVRETSEILQRASIQPNIFWEEGLGCVCLEWECPVGYLTINVYKTRLSIFQNLNGHRLTMFDATLNDAIDAYNNSHDVLWKYANTYEIDEAE